MSKEIPLVIPAIEPAPAPPARARARPRKDGLERDVSHKPAPPKQATAPASSTPASSSTKKRAP